MHHVGSTLSELAATRSLFPGAASGKTDVPLRKIVLHPG